MWIKKKNDISVFKKMMLLKTHKGCFFMRIKIEVNHNLFLITNNSFDVINNQVINNLND